MQRLLVLLFPGLLLACSGGGAGTTTTSRGDGGTPTTTQGLSGKCVGNAKPAHSLTGYSSCEPQGGHYEPLPANTCHDSGHACEDYNDADVFSDGKERCMNRIGCAWEHPDGTHEISKEASGTCSGTPVPCDRIQEKTSCGGRCAWNDAHATAYCEPRNSYDWLDNADCAGLDEALKTYASADPIAVKLHCQDVLGCTWRDGDGRSPSYVGGIAP